MKDEHPNSTEPEQFKQNKRTQAALQGERINITGYINMSYLLPATARAIRDYYQRSDWEELFDLISPETAALMFFRLRKASDEIFPHGKWATIQRLEFLIEEMDEIKRKQPEK